MSAIEQGRLAKLPRRRHHALCHSLEIRFDRDEGLDEYFVSSCFSEKKGDLENQPLYKATISLYIFLKDNIPIKTPYKLFHIPIFSSSSSSSNPSPPQKKNHQVHPHNHTNKQVQNTKKKKRM